MNKWLILSYLRVFCRRLLRSVFPFCIHVLLILLFAIVFDYAGGSSPSPLIHRFQNLLDSFRPPPIRVLFISVFSFTWKRLLHKYLRALALSCLEVLFCGWSSFWTLSILQQIINLGTYIRSPFVAPHSSILPSRRDCGADDLLWLTGYQVRYLTMLCIFILSTHVGVY